MEPIGRTLYASYVAALLAQGGTTDSWDDLTPQDQAAWELTAEKFLATMFPAGRNSRFAVPQ